MEKNTTTLKRHKLKETERTRGGFMGIIEIGNALPLFSEIKWVPHERNWKSGKEQIMLWYYVIDRRELGCHTVVMVSISAGDFWSILGSELLIQKQVQKRKSSTAIFVDVTNQQVKFVLRSHQNQYGNHRTGSVLSWCMYRHPESYTHVRYTVIWKFPLDYLQEFSFVTT